MDVIYLKTKLCKLIFLIFYVFIFNSSKSRFFVVLYILIFLYWSVLMWMTLCFISHSFYLSMTSMGCGILRFFLQARWPCVSTRIQSMTSMGCGIFFCSWNVRCEEFSNDLAFPMEWICSIVVFALLIFNYFMNEFYGWIGLFQVLLIY